MMKVERFYTLVEECLGGGCSPGELALDEAARTAHVVLTVMARRLNHDERLRIALGLPRRLAVELVAADQHPDADPIARVACELQVDPDVAERRVCCVLDAIRQAAGVSLPPALASLTP